MSQADESYSTLAPDRPQPSVRPDPASADVDAAATHLDSAAPYAAKAGKVPLPATTQPLRMNWWYLISLALVHLYACLVVVPYFFTWSAVVVALVTYVGLNMFGVTIGYHRLLTHRGFSCPKWMEHSLAICGVCTLQDSPARWVAIHRMHHQHSDEQPDPHTPLSSFWWGHMVWLFVRNRDHDGLPRYERYVRDLLRDPFYFRLERSFLWLKIYALHAVAIMVLGFAFGLATTETTSAALRVMWSWAVWGIAFRTVATLHITWAVNSVTHLWGYRNYDTRDNSRNNWWVALLAFGEGWHNNHHAYQRSAQHGHRWWEFDMSWAMIRCWEKLGLVDNVVRAPSDET